MPYYSDSPLWGDVEPLPQDDGGPDALATIAYTQDYSEAISYLRAIMAAEEFSPRVLDLTEHVIGMNPAHYTVWLYRAKTLQELNYSISAELHWLNGVALSHIKNYQIWHHRQTLLTRLDPEAFDPTTKALSTVMQSEIDFLNEMLDKDAKNYHVWSYRQWLVQRFGLWDESSNRLLADKTYSGELDETLRWLNMDIRNNSAWNHRYFVVFGNKMNRAVSKEIFDREIEFAQKSITIAPQNESAWNYLKAVLKKSGRGIKTVEDFVKAFAWFDSDNVEGSPEGQTEVDAEDAVHDEGEYEDIIVGSSAERVRSSFALDVLADICANDPGRAREAKRALELLRDKYDPIRANYWNWRISKIDKSAV